MLDKVKQYVKNVFDIAYRFFNKLWQLFMGFLIYVSHKSVRLGDVFMVAMAVVVMFCGFATVVSDDVWVRCIAFCGAVLQTFFIGILSAGYVDNL